jgi:hypothetical protein
MTLSSQPVRPVAWRLSHEEMPLRLKFEYFAQRHLRPFDLAGEHSFAEVSGDSRISGLGMPERTPS